MGFVKIAYGCNLLEMPDFKGKFRCEYATDKQLNIDDLRKELKKK